MPLATSLLIVAALALSAQVRQPTALSTGSVAGVVTDRATNVPVRFAQIVLVPSEHAEHNQAAHLLRVTGTSGLDGTFRLDGVPAGDYFIAALKAGYVTQGASTDVDASDDEIGKLFRALPTAHVKTGEVASANLTLRGGAVIAGRLRFADGSPAVGQTVRWDLSESVTSRSDLRGKVVSDRLATALAITGYENRHPEAITDDRGQFRLFGLPPGKYVVSTLVGINQNAAARVSFSDGSGAVSGGREHIYPEMISVFAPGTFLRRGARLFEIRGDEQILDADFKIDPTGLHTLKGKVLAAEDRHTPSGAMVQFRDGDSKDISRFADIENDGSFQFHYLPSGTYLLEISSNDFGTAADAQPLTQTEMSDLPL